MRVDCPTCLMLGPCPVERIVAGLALTAALHARVSAHATGGRRGLREIEERMPALPGNISTATLFEVAWLKTREPEMACFEARSAVPPSDAA
jgi:hypothetical protein